MKRKNKQGEGVKPQEIMIPYSEAKAYINDVVLRFVMGNDKASKLLDKYADDYGDNVKELAIELVITLVAKDIKDLNEFYEDQKDNRLAMKALEVALQIRETMNFV